MTRGCYCSVPWFGWRALLRPGPVAVVRRAQLRSRMAVGHRQPPQFLRGGGAECDQRAGRCDGRSLRRQGSESRRSERGDRPCRASARPWANPPWALALHGVLVHLTAAVAHLLDALTAKRLGHYQVDVSKALADLEIAQGRPGQYDVLGGMSGAIGNTALDAPARSGIENACMPPSRVGLGLYHGYLAWRAVPMSALGKGVRNPGGTTIRRSGDLVVFATAAQPRVELLRGRDTATACADPGGSRPEGNTGSTSRNGSARFQPSRPRSVRSRPATCGDQNRTFGRIAIFRQNDSVPAWLSRAVDRHDLRRTRQWDRPALPWITLSTVANRQPIVAALPAAVLGQDRTAPPQLAASA